MAKRNSLIMAGSLGAVGVVDDSLQREPGHKAPPQAPPQKRGSNDHPGQKPEPRPAPASAKGE